jgi:hypothetical protein
MQQHLQPETMNDWVELVKSEFLEMPGLHLSKRQAQRLWNLDGPSTEAILGRLESSQFLRRIDDDMYIRVSPTTLEAVTHR